MHAQFVGTVERYYPNAHAALVDLSGSGLKVGDQVHIVGPWDDCWQEVVRIEVDHRAVPGAPKGEVIGLQVDRPVHHDAEVWKLRWVD